jgi:hypothetical protein
MPGEETYDLHIDAFTPESIPMARLAEYMSSFADLLGHQDHVHFGKLKAGSLCVTARVDEVARPKIIRRMEELRLGGEAPNAAQKARKDIDDKLAEDNATGRILRGSAKLIEFPGRLRPVELKLGPIVQPGSLDGEVIQIGGKDATINVHLKTGDEIYHCVTDKATARRLAPHIFETLRVTGTGTWARLESGGWILKKFQISEFNLLDETPLSRLFDGLRSRHGPPECGRVDPVDLMRQLRED